MDEFVRFFFLDSINEINSFLNRTKYKEIEDSESKDCICIDNLYGEYIWFHKESLVFNDFYLYEYNTNENMSLSKLRLLEINSENS